MLKVAVGKGFGSRFQVQGRILAPSPIRGRWTTPDKRDGTEGVTRF